MSPDPTRPLSDTLFIQDPGDWLEEVHDIECIAENFRLGLSGFGHEDDYAALPDRIERALAFRVGGDERCVRAKTNLRRVAVAFGFNLATEEAYFGQPIPRQRVEPDVIRSSLPPMKPYAVQLSADRLDTLIANDPGVVGEGR